MSDFQKDIEQIIKNNINAMTGSRQQKRSLHITHQHLELVDELYGSDQDAIVFINHFGHIEYHNRAFSKMMMLDRHSQSFSSIYNLEQLNIGFENINGTIHVTYPNGTTYHMTFIHQLVDFQKSILLQLRFRDITEIHHACKALKDLQKKTSFYLEHLPSPMFLLNATGDVVHVPDNSMDIFGQRGKMLKDENIFEALPFDYASQIMDKIKSITPKTNGHFMHQTEKDKIIKVYDTTVHMVDEELYLVQISDVSDLNTMSSTIEYLNSYDSLTGFYNTNHYENTLSNFKDSGHLPMGVYSLTLNGLKRVNMAMGYHQCDSLLIDIALNMKSLISQHEIPCRITGDTFVIFFPNISKNTMDKFNSKMTAFIEGYKETYKEYRLSYIEKNVLINDSTTDIHALLNGMTV